MNNAPDKYPLLDGIVAPADLRHLPVNRLPTLARELREFLIQTVSTRGGHFAALEQPAIFASDLAAYADVLAEQNVF